MEKGIKGAVDILWDIGRGDAEIKTMIMKKYSLTEKMTVNIYNLSKIDPEQAGYCFIRFVLVL